MQSIQIHVRRLVGQVSLLVCLSVLVGEPASAGCDAACLKCLALWETVLAWVPPISQGASAIGADDWHQAGLTGEGIKVGVLDTGFDRWDQVLPTRNIGATGPPSPDPGAAWLPGAGSHGTAVAEVILGTAPNVVLYLARPLSACLEDFAAAVEWLEQQQVDVINHSVGYAYDKGGLGGQGPLNQIVNCAVTPPKTTKQGVRACPLNPPVRDNQKQIIWVNAAGNQAQQHWTGNFRDRNGDGINEFLTGSGGTSDTNGLLGNCPNHSLWMLWDDPFDNPIHQYDLCAEGIRNGQVVDHGCAPADPNHPIRRLGITSEAGITYRVQIRHTGGGATPNQLHLMNMNGCGSLQYPQEQQSLLIPADNPNVISVAAANVSQWSVPIPTPVSVEAFSSRGPNARRMPKPDITAPDVVGTLTEFDPKLEVTEDWTAIDYGNLCGIFTGTSAAAPHVTGAVALLLQTGRYPDMAGVMSFFDKRALDIGAPGQDNESGVGLLRLGVPIPTRPPTTTPTATPTLTPTSLNFHGRPFA